MTAEELATPIIKPGDTVLGKYRVERLLGEGGMGTVVAIRHTELDELFAMKVMKPGVMKQAGSVERFIREARAAAKLRSDHVARVYDVGRLENGMPYMLMEHLSGCDLHTMLSTHGKFKASEVAAFLLETLDAVSEAHALGIIHRDLKPENLFIARKPNRTTSLKVLDFGISKVVNENAPSTTHTSNMVGSPYYMSPEQMRVQKDIDGRTDIWALGVIGYELLTDSIPFPGESVTSVCAAVLECNPPPIQSFAPDVPDEMVRIVSRCLQRKREDRFQTSEDLAAALQRVARDLGAPPRISLPSIPDRSPERPRTQSLAAIKLQRIADPSRTTSGAFGRVTGTSMTGLGAVREEGGGSGTTEELERRPRTPSGGGIPRTDSSSALLLAVSTPDVAPPSNPGGSRPSLGPTIQGWSESPPSFPKRRPNRRLAAVIGVGVAAIAATSVLVIRSRVSHDANETTATHAASHVATAEPTATAVAATTVTVAPIASAQPTAVAATSAAPTASGVAVNAAPFGGAPGGVGAGLGASIPGAAGYPGAAYPGAPVAGANAAPFKPGQPAGAPATPPPATPPPTPPPNAGGHEGIY